MGGVGEGSALKVRTVNRRVDPGRDVGTGVEDVCDAVYSRGELDQGGRQDS